MDVSMHTKFIPGIELNRHFYLEIIKPLMDKKFPNLKYSCALIGYGSDVLGVDNFTSTDHNWGPRSYIFLDREDIGLKDRLNEMFCSGLPLTFRGYPTNFSQARYDGTQSMEETLTHPVNHMIKIHELDGYFNRYLGIDDINVIGNNDWIKFADQKLIELTSREIYHDGLDGLIRVTERLKFYPLDVLKLKLASLWLSVSNEEAFVGRCIEIDDFIGLKLIVTRITATLMKIMFYLERKYIPYSKWFGTFFKKLNTSKSLSGIIKAVLTENDPVQIHEKLCSIYTVIIQSHNNNSDLPNIKNKIQNYFNRPYNVILAETIVKQIIDSIQDENIKKMDLRCIGLDVKCESIDFG